MEELLSLWEMPAEVKKKFNDNGITPDQLKDVIEGDLLKELVPSIGLRITIRKKIQEHLTALTDTVTISTYEDSISDEIDVENIKIDDLFLPKPVLPHFELKTLLTTSPCGKSILKYYEVNIALDNKHRNQLTEIIIRHIYTYIVNNHITHEDYNVITAKIITLFPAENIGTYFVPAIKKRESISGKPVFSKGKLVDKVRNILYKSGERKRKQIQENDNPVENKKSLQELEDKNEDKIVWLKNNIEPWQQVIDYWTATYDIRSATNYLTVADFVCQWNILNDVRGEQLINIDFDKRYQKCTSNFFLKWNLFFNRVIELKEASIKDDGILNDLEELKQETEDDKKIIKQIMLLCRLIPPRGRLNRKVKFSTVECIEGIVVNVATPGDIQHRIETVARQAQTNKTTVQPYIVACESQSATASYYLVIDTIKYNFTSATKALDTLFKCYHTLHATYPKASDHMYLIIQRGVYGIKTKYDNVVPYIADILNLI